MKSYQWNKNKSHRKTNSSAPLQPFPLTYSTRLAENLAQSSGFATDNFACSSSLSNFWSVTYFVAQHWRVLASCYMPVLDTAYCYQCMWWALLTLIVGLLSALLTLILNLLSALLTLVNLLSALLTLVILLSACYQHCLLLIKKQLFPALLTLVNLLSALLTFVKLLSTLLTLKKNCYQHCLLLSTCYQHCLFSKKQNKTKPVTSTVYSGEKRY